MAPLMIRKLGLALVLLLTGFASGPFGGTEQAPERLPGQPAFSPSVQAAQLAAAARPHDLRARPDQRTPGTPHELFLPLPGGPHPPAVSRALVLGARAGRPPATLPPRICERLPYDANAPPAPV